MSISFEQVGHMSITLPAGSCKLGQVCKLDTAGKAAACSDDDAFCGVVESIREGCAGVQIHGFAEIPYSGTVPTPGYVLLSADDAGGVKAGTDGTRYLCVQADTTKKTVTIEL